MQQLQENMYEQEIVLVQNLESIYKHLKLILNHPDFYYIELPHIYFGASPIGKRKVYLGDILQLWQRSAHWYNRQHTRLELVDGWSRGRKTECSNAQGFYVLNSVGSALSGSNNTLAWDFAQQKMIRVMLPSMFVLLKDLEGISSYRPVKPVSEFKSDVGINDLIQHLHI